MKQENIKNLTSFWENGAKPYAGLKTMNGFNSASVENSGWPNRIWQGPDFNFNKIESMITEMQNSSVKLTLPVWQPADINDEVHISDNSLMLKFRQVGMSLSLSDKFLLKDELTVIPVSDGLHVKIWSSIYPLAFNYEFPQHVLLNTYDKFEYYLFMRGEEPVGTGILFTEDDISGIHGIGVPPYARRRGYAEEITKYLVNRSMELGSHHAVLQASDMGYGIYKKLGFNEDFRISNYILA